MDEKPETKGKSIFSGGMAINLILEGIMIAALSLTAYFAGQIVFHDLSAARTMTFSVLALSQLVHSFNMHSKKPICVSGLSGWTNALDFLYNMHRTSGCTCVI